jgi:REP element-mobilizing transposase RayT
VFDAQLPTLPVAVARCAKLTTLTVDMWWPDNHRALTRPFRLEFPGALYHVTSRGNRRSWIYRDDTDRLAWLDIVALVCQRHHCIVHSFYLMSNHFHLMIETVEANLGQVMRQLNGIYTQHFNRRHHTVSHLFQGRYKAILVQKESYLLELSRYIVLNPLRANIVASLDEWPWSSHGYYIGIAPAPAWLECDWLLSQFGACRTQAVTACLEFVFAGIGKGSPLVETRHRVLLGDDEFVAEHQRLQQSEGLVETARDERAAVALSLEEYRSRIATERKRLRAHICQLPSRCHKSRMLSTSRCRPLAAP